MKRLLSIVFAAATVAALPLSAHAHDRRDIAVHDHGRVAVYERGYAPERHVRERYVVEPVVEPYVVERRYRSGAVYAPSAYHVRTGEYVPPRRWVDRNHDGMDDRRGRRDMDRDGVPDAYDRDLDNDGIANRYDRDIDGDGVRNWRDRRPDNPRAY